MCAPFLKLINGYGKTIKFCNFQSMELLLTIYACNEDINVINQGSHSRHDFPILHISMTQQKLSTKTYFPPVIPFPGTSVFLVLHICSCSKLSGHSLYTYMLYIRHNLWKGRIWLNLTDLGTIQMLILIIFTLYGMILSTQKCFQKRFNLWSIPAQSMLNP